MKTTLLHNATIITAEKEAVGTIYIKEGNFFRTFVRFSSEHEHMFDITKLY